MCVRPTFRFATSQIHFFVIELVVPIVLYTSPLPELFSGKLVLCGMSFVTQNSVNCLLLNCDPLSVTFFIGVQKLLNTMYLPQYIDNYLICGSIQQLSPWPLTSFLNSQQSYTHDSSHKANQWIPPGLDTPEPARDSTAISAYFSQAANMQRIIYMCPQLCFITLANTLPYMLSALFLWLFDKQCAMIPIPDYEVILVWITWTRKTPPHLTLIKLQVPGRQSTISTRFLTCRPPMLYVFLCYPELLVSMRFFLIHGGNIFGSDTNSTDRY